MLLAPTGVRGPEPAPPNVSPRDGGRAPRAPRDTAAAASPCPFYGPPTVGCPSAFQAVIPPDMLVTHLKPARMRMSRACRLRFPDRHTTTMYRSRGTSSILVPSSPRGMSVEPGIWDSAHSSGWRTSRRKLPFSRMDAAWETGISAARPPVPVGWWVKRSKPMAAAKTA